MECPHCYMGTLKGKFSTNGQIVLFCYKCKIEFGIIEEFENMYIDKPCPVCGNRKRRHMITKKYLICRSCFRAVDRTEI